MGRSGWLKAVRGALFSYTTIIIAKFPIYNEIIKIYNIFKIM